MEPSGAVAHRASGTGAAEQRSAADHAARISDVTTDMSASDACECVLLKPACFVKVLSDHRNPASLITEAQAAQGVLAEHGITPPPARSFDLVGTKGEHVAAKLSQLLLELEQLPVANLDAAASRSGILARVAAVLCHCGSRLYAASKWVVMSREEFHELHPEHSIWLAVNPMPAETFRKFGQ